MVVDMFYNIKSFLDAFGYAETTTSENVIVIWNLTDSEGDLRPTDLYYTLENTTLSINTATTVINTEFQSPLVMIG